MATLETQAPRIDVDALVKKRSNLKRRFTRVRKRLVREQTKDHSSNKHLLKDSIEAEICRQEINALLDVIRSHYESQENELLQILDQWSEDFDVETDIIADLSAFLKWANFPTTALDDVITRNQMPHPNAYTAVQSQAEDVDQTEIFFAGDEETQGSDPTLNVDSALSGLLVSQPHSGAPGFRMVD